MTGLSLQLGFIPGVHAVQHTGAALVGDDGSPGKVCSFAHTWFGRQSAGAAHARMQSPGICDHGSGAQTVPSGQTSSPPSGKQVVGLLGEPTTQ